jgi:putative transposase
VGEPTSPIAWKVEETGEPKEQKKAGVDFGERHLATIFLEDEGTISVHGGRLRLLLDFSPG